MNTNHRPISRQHGFTLIELLTVIAIIAILMGLLFAGMGTVKDQARKTEAKAACIAIVNSVRAYYTEYGKYPNPTASSTAPTTDVIVGDTTYGGASVSNAALFNILRAKPVGTNAAHALNPRRIIFFEGKDATNPHVAKGGFSSLTGAFYDPWGAEYNVAIDTDYDNQLNTLPYLDFKYAADTTSKAPQTGCGAFSLGKDGALGTRTGGSGAGDNYFKATSGTFSDDIISWQ